jgi:hypothetical protein
MSGMARKEFPLPLNWRANARVAGAGSRCRPAWPWTAAMAYGVALGPSLFLR